MYYDMQFMKFLSLLKKRGLSYAISEIFIPSLKTWTIICNFWNFFPFSKNADYYMQFLEFRSNNKDYDMQFMKFLSLLKKRGLSYAISEIFIPSLKMWTIMCNFRNFFPFLKNVDYYIPFMEFRSKNMDYDTQFMEILSLLKKHGLLYAIYGNSFT